MQIASLSRRNRFCAIKDTKIITNFAVRASQHRNFIFATHFGMHEYNCVFVKTAVYTYR